MSVLEMSSFDLLLSFAVTWGLGLAPALVARYAWYKQPLPKKNANWIAGTTSVAFWLLFLFLNAAAGQERGSGAVWILVFFVNRWLMTRGHSDAVDASSVTEGPGDSIRTLHPPFEADPVRNNKRVRAGMIGLFAFGVAAGTLGAVVFMHIYAPRIDTSRNTFPDRTVVSENMGGLPVSVYPQIYRDGTHFNQYELVRQYEANPNRFQIVSKNVSYKVIGKISRVSDFSASLNETMGFYVPLLVKEGPWDQAVAGRPSPSVSLFVKGVDLGEAAALHIGQSIEVNCPSLRIVGGDIVFDDCEQESGSS